MFSFDFLVLFFEWVPNVFRMVLQWFYNSFPMIFRWLSNGFPMISRWFPYGFPMVPSCLVLSCLSVFVSACLNPCVSVSVCPWRILTRRLVPPTRNQSTATFSVGLLLFVCARLCVDLSCLVLSCFRLAWRASLCLALPCLALPCLALPCPALS